MSSSETRSAPADAHGRPVDIGLSALLVLQCVILFAVLPLSDGSTAAHLVLDACHLAFTVICIGVLTRHRGIQVALLVLLVLLVGGPAVRVPFGAAAFVDPAVQHELIAVIAFVFNAGVSALVFRHVFAPGRVTVHRVRGAILLYLNVAALFAIAYGAIAMVDGGAFAFANGSAEPLRHGGTVAFAYFSLSTITTTGFGDIVPVHPFARSLANLEAVFGQLFPATLLARLVSLHLAHEERDV